MNTAQMRTWAEIDLNNLDHNYRSIRNTLPDGCMFLGVVKANAYGHGAVEVAQRLEKLGAERFAVACIDEVRHLREAGLKKPIMILGYTPPELADELLGLDVEQAVGDIAMARELSRRVTAAGKTLKIHIKLDTGMGRLGFPVHVDKSLWEAEQAVMLPGLEAVGVFTHFAVSDEFRDPFTQEQYAKFADAVRFLEEGVGRRFEIKHCANSGAVINYEELSLDMVRPGLATYGMYPAAERGRLDLLPVMSLKTRIADIREYGAGESVSYGRTFIAEEKRRIAVLPIGYADGLHRVLSNKMDVLIAGKRARQVGRICMDMCMVDITHLPDCRIGDVVTIFGKDGDDWLPIEEQAAKAGTISYELVCSVSRRVPRIYFE